MFPNYPGAERDPNRTRPPTTPRSDVNFEADELARRRDDHARRPERARVTRTSTTTTSRRRGEEITRSGRQRGLQRRRSPPFQKPGTERVRLHHGAVPDPTGPTRSATTADCAWDPDDRDSWRDQPRAERRPGVLLRQRRSTTTCERAPIGFDATDGNFEGDDPVEVNTDDGMPTPPAAGPDADHVNNANMSTPPDGESPLMQMYLFRYDGPDAFFNVPQHQRRRRRGDGLARVHARALEPPDHARRRLRRHLQPAHRRDGRGVERLVRARPAASPRARDRHARRSATSTSACTPMRCSRRRASSRSTARPADDAAPRCPGGIATGPGGFTFGDFGLVARRAPRCTPTARSGCRRCGTCGRADRRSRRAGRLRRGRAAGHAGDAAVAARAVVPGHAQRDPGRRRRTGGRRPRHDLGRLRRSRHGLSSPASPTRATSRRPRTSTSRRTPNAPKGNVAGTVTSADTGLPLPGVTVGFGGLTTVTNPPFPDYLAATSGANGAYSLQAPAGTYGDLVYDRPGWDRVVVSPVEVPAGGTRALNFALRRDWAAARGGARRSTRRMTPARRSAAAPLS